MRIQSIMVATAILFTTHTVSAGETEFGESYLQTFVDHYPWTIGTKLDSCDTCHESSSDLRNPYGQTIEYWLIDMGKTIDGALNMSRSTDSDGDGFANMDEIDFITFPGDATDFPPACSESDIDGDGYATYGSFCGPIDCNDNDEFINPGAIEECADGVDNDCDGLVDSQDSDCDSCVPSRDTEKGKTCKNGIDDDCDGLTDADDPDCGSDDGGGGGTPEICDDGIDNDNNGKVDCEDRKACRNDPACP